MLVKGDWRPTTTYKGYFIYIIKGGYSLPMCDTEFIYQSNYYDKVSFLLGEGNL